MPLRPPVRICVLFYPNVLVYCVSMFWKPDSSWSIFPLRQPIRIHVLFQALFRVYCVSIIWQHSLIPIGPLAFTPANKNPCLCVRPGSVFTVYQCSGSRVWWTGSGGGIMLSRLLGTASSLGAVLLTSVSDPDSGVFRIRNPDPGT